MSHNVISLNDKRPDPHISGAAICLACRHEWTGVAPIGVFELECPECSTMRGVWRYPLKSSADYAIWTCTVDGCECQHMTIAAHKEGGYWIECCRCGYLHSVESVFPK